jgi:putative ABC transport system permease protein
LTGALALASLRRHPVRTLLATLGVAIAAALLLDMVMLATGMQSSFRRFLLMQGFQIRISPRGTLPFDSEATIGDATAIARALRANRDVVAVSPVLGAQVHILRHGRARAATSFALGIDGSVEGDYELTAGAHVSAPDRVVVNDAMRHASGVRVGDTLDVAAGLDPQLREYTGLRRLVVAGTGRFYYTAANQPVMAMPLETLQAMGGPERADRVSLFMVKVRDGTDPEGVARWANETLPRVTTISTASALHQVDNRLGYFRQLALILGAVSLVVGFLLVTTLVTVSVQDRLGEIAVLRAIGVSRWHVIRQIVVESLVLTVAGAVAGVAMGLITARYLDAILSTLPGLPAAFHFFVFRPSAAWETVALLVGSGVLAAIYPSWRASSLPVAPTLRGEAVA